MALALGLVIVLEAMPSWGKFRRWEFRGGGKKQNS